MDLYLLPSLVLLPLLGAVVCALIGRLGVGAGAKGLALLTAGMTFLLSCFTATQFGWNQPGDQLVTAMGAFAPIGFSFKFGADALSLLLAITTSLLSTLAIVASFSSVKSREGTYYGWLLVLLAALNGVWVARDLLLFYGFFELMLVPLFFLIGSFGGVDRRSAAAKIFIYTFTGSILALPAILYVGIKAGTFDMASAITFAQTKFSDTERFWVVLGLLASFCVKTPVFPLHTWQPSAMAEAPGNGVVDCSGLVLKLGAYAILKIAIPIGFVTAAGEVAFPGLLKGVAVLALIGIIYGALCAWVQTDMKRVLAYSSLSHVGFIVLGILALTDIGIQGASLYLINTALSTGAMFLVVGMIYERYGTRDMTELSGLGKKMPIMAFFFGLFTMAGIGLPVLNGFVSEFLAILGTFKSPHLGIVYGCIAALGIVLGAIYMLNMAARVLFGPVKVPVESAEVLMRGDLNFREVSLLMPLAVLVVVLGVFPTPVLNSLKNTAKAVPGVVVTAPEAKTNNETVAIVRP